MFAFPPDKIAFFVFFEFGRRPFLVNPHDSEAWFFLLRSRCQLANWFFLWEAMMCPLLNIQNGCFFLKAFPASQEHDGRQDRNPPVASLRR